MLVSMTIINTKVYILLNVIFLFSIGFMYYIGAKAQRKFHSAKNITHYLNKSGKSL